MTPTQKALIEKLDDIIDKLAELTTLLEASFETQPEIEADPLAGHPELPLATEDDAETRWAPVEA
jgi:hypothetical protein